MLCCSEVGLLNLPMQDTAESEPPSRAVLLWGAELRNAREDAKLS